MHNIKIMILEDHALTRHMLVLALRRLGYLHLYCAEGGEQAFELLRAEGSFDVLICDIQMEGVDGLAFLRKARELGSICALVVSSAIAADLRLAIQQLARLLGYQVLGDLEKPFCVEHLHGLLQRYQTSVRGPSPAIATLPLAGLDVEQSLARGEFIAHFQPKVNLQTLETVGAEALVRWQHPRHGLLTPGLFLPIVAREGALDAMTQAILSQSLRFLHDGAWRTSFCVSVNLEASQLASPRLVETVREALEMEAVSAGQLMIEITETGLMQAPITSIENLVRLRLMGCGVSIDDFGAGFSSVQRVCEMPCTELKLDASFVRSMVYNSRSMAAIDSLRHLTEQLGIALVVEGIETREQFRLLQTLGCTIGQGYFFSRPLSGRNFMEWCRR